MARRRKVAAPPAGHDGGDCFLAAIKNMSGDVDTLVCHGIVHGQGPLEGYVFPHAWNELNGMVIDKSNGNDLMMPADLYYAIGRIDDRDVIKYTVDEVLDNVDRTGHAGPWDESLAFDWREANMKKSRVAKRTKKTARVGAEALKGYIQGWMDSWGGGLDGTDAQVVEDFLDYCEEQGAFKMEARKARRKHAASGEWDNDYDQYQEERGFLDGFEMCIMENDEYSIECTVFDEDGNEAQRWIEQTSSPEAARKACEQRLQQMSYYRMRNQ